VGAASDAIQLHAAMLSARCAFCNWFHCANLADLFAIPRARPLRYAHIEAGRTLMKNSLPECRNDHVHLNLTHFKRLDAPTRAR